MTVVTIYKTNNRIVGFIIDGHSGYAAEGEDIVCASISLLATTVINSLDIVAGINKKNIDFYIDEEQGYLSLDTRDSFNEKSDIIYNTFLVGIQSIVDDYGDFVTLITEEV